MYPTIVSLKKHEKFRRLCFRCHLGNLKGLCFIFKLTETAASMFSGISRGHGAALEDGK